MGGKRMSLWQKTAKAVGVVVNLQIDQWLDLQGLKKTTRYFFQQGKQLFKVQQAQYAESFEEAVHRLELTPELLNLQKKRYLSLSLFFLVIVLALFGYTIFLIMAGNKMGALTTLALAFYAGSMVFRFHFWYFQISQKKLGCAMREWLSSQIISSEEVKP